MLRELTAQCFLPSVYLVDCLPLICEAGVNIGIIIIIQLLLRHAHVLSSTILIKFSWLMVKQIKSIKLHGKMIFSQFDEKINCTVNMSKMQIII